MELLQNLDKIWYNGLEKIVVRELNLGSRQFNNLKQKS
jgi:hypothetical protein